MIYTINILKSQYVKHIFQLTICKIANGTPPPQ